MNGNKRSTTSKMSETRNRFKREYDKIECFILIVMMIASNEGNRMFWSIWNDALSDEAFSVMIIISASTNQTFSKHMQWDQRRNEHLQCNY